MSADLTKLLKRIEEEFEIVHHLGHQGKSFCLRSAMLNVTPLINEIKNLEEKIENIRYENEERE